MQERYSQQQCGTCRKKAADHFFAESLPLFSNGQQAESAVKEAKNVSLTGRCEELRTVFAIGRSSVLSACDKTMTGKEKAKAVIRFILEQHRRLESKKDADQRS